MGVSRCTGSDVVIGMLANVDAGCSVSARRIGPFECKVSCLSQSTCTLPAVDVRDSHQEIRSSADAEPVC